MLVGRENELNVLNASFRQMLEGKGNILFLTGEAGLGKTTLIHEWWKTIAPDSAIYAEAACSIPIGNVDVGRLEALQPWADVVAQLQAIGSEEKKKLDLKKLIRDAAPAWAWAIPVVGGLVHAALETAQVITEQRTTANMNAQNQQQVFQQYVNLLTKIAEETPLVILLDDMHWADTSSTNLLFYLSRQIASKKILVLATYRPEETATSNNGKGHPVITVKNEIIRYESGKEIALEYLGGEAIQELLRKKFGEYKVDDTFEGWLKKISDGNSLFVTQFIKTLQEDGTVDERGSFIGDYNKISIPTSALAVVEERTRRLDKDTRDLLRYATAEGEEFTSYVLSHITQKKPLELLQELRKAESAEVVRSKGSTRMYANQTTMIYGYSHALFHKALYDSLYEQEKDILHKECYTILKAEWDRLANNRSLPLASKLLTHAEKSNEHKVAAEVALDAAKTAWQTYAEAEAMEMLAHVFRLAQVNPEQMTLLRIDALLLQADIYKLHGRYDESLAAAATALERSQMLHDNTRAASAMQRIGTVHAFRGAYNEALEYYLASHTIHESLGNKAILAGSLNYIGNVYYMRGAFNEALEYYKKSLAMQETIGERKGIAMALNNVGLVHHFQGDYNEALEYFAKSLAIAETIGEKAGIGMLFNNIGNVYDLLGEYDKALENHSKALAIRESIGDRAGVAASLTNIGNIHKNRETYGDSLEFYLKGLMIYESLGDRAGIATALGNIGNIHYHRGSPEEGLEYQSKALAIRESIGDQPGIASSLVTIEIIHRKRGNFPEARIAITKAKNIAVEIQSKYLYASALCELGLLSEAEAMQCADAAYMEKMHDAVTFFEEGVAVFREIKSRNLKQNEIELERIKNLITNSDNARRSRTRT